MKNTQKEATDIKNEELLEIIDKKINGNIEDIKSINDEGTYILVQLEMMLQYIDSLSKEVKDWFINLLKFTLFHPFLMYLFYYHIA